MTVDRLHGQSTGAYARGVTGPRVWFSMLNVAQLKIPAWLIGFVLPFTTNAAVSEFGFDPNGNLFSQVAESPAVPQILAQPQRQVVQPGEMGVFNVVVADTRGLSYQWLFNGANFDGATNDVLMLPNVNLSNQGPYSVVLSSSSGSVTSSVAQLYIDSRGVGMPDSWQMLYFGNLNQSPTGDFDGDGVSNLQEFLDGTNPADKASARFRLSVSGIGAVVNQNPNRLSYTNGEVVTVTATPFPPYSFRIWGGDVVSTNNPVTVTMTNNKAVVAYAGPCNIFWTNRASGDWNNPANWSPNLVPGTNDNVTINNAVTVTVTNSVECGGLILGTPGILPTLSVSGHLTLDGLCYWYAGTFTGGGKTIISPTATLTIDNPSTVYINSCTLENDGSILWPGANDISLNSADLTNAPGALFLTQNSASLTGSGSVFDNSGTFRKSDSTGRSLVSVVFNNFGTVDIQSGTLQCNGTFANNGSVALAPNATLWMSGGGSAAGSFTAPGTALVEWTGSPFTPAFNLNPGVQLNGPGLYRLDGTTVNFNTDLTVQNLDAVSIAGSGGISLNGGGTLTVSNFMNWLGGGGSMGGSGTTVIAPGATFNVGNSFTLSRTLENGGIIVWTNGVFSVNSAVITNRTGALLDAQTANTFGTSGSRFDNAGTFRKSVSAGSTLVALNLNNYATVDLQSGTLQCNAKFANNGSVALAASTTLWMSGGGSAAGSFTAAGTALVEWIGSPFTPAFNLNPGVQLNGPGAYRVDGAKLYCNTDLTVPNLDLILVSGSAQSSLDGTGTVTVGRNMTWLEGDMSGSGRTIIAPGATLSAANPGTVFLNRTLENGGTVVCSGGDLSLGNAVITNRAGALFNIQSTAALSGSGSRFDNAGTFRKSVSAGTTSVGLNFDNYGTVDLQTGVLAANAGYTSSSDAVLNCYLGGTNYGQLQVRGAVNLDGGLSVNLMGGYLPATNDTFTVVSAGTRNNTFATFSYPSNRVIMQLTNTPNSVVLAVSGVLPWAAPALLFPPSLTGSNIFLSWSATPNFTYRLEYSPSLSQTDWFAVPGDVIATSGTVTKTDPLTSTNRFYRVRILP